MTRLTRRSVVAGAGVAASLAALGSGRPGSDRVGSRRESGPPSARGPQSHFVCLEPRPTNNDARVTDEFMAVAIVALCALEPARVYRRLEFGVEASTNGLVIWPAAPPPD